MDADDRLTKLEERVANQERTIEELSNQIAEQWRLLESLRKRAEALTERFQTLEFENAPRTEPAKPPHW